MQWQLARLGLGAKAFWATVDPSKTAMSRPPTSHDGRETAFNGSLEGLLQMS